MNRRKSIFDHLPQTEKINDSDSESSKSEDEDLDSSQSSKRSGKSSLIEATSKSILIHYFYLNFSKHTFLTFSF